MSPPPVRAGIVALVATPLVGLLIGACSAPFEAPSAYTEQRFLCGAETSAEWTTLVDECAETFQRDGSCQGLIGLRGKLQGQEIVVQTQATRVLLTEAQSDRELPFLAGFLADAKSPYFNLEIELKQVGGTARVASEVPRALKIADEKHGPEVYTDDYAQLGLRLSVGGESQRFRGYEGEVAFVVPVPNALRGTFRGSFGGDGKLEGCFAVFGPEMAPGQSSR